MDRSGVVVLLVRAEDAERAVAAVKAALAPSGANRAWEEGAGRILDARRAASTAPRTPKDGDRLDSFTAAELDGLPVGSAFGGKVAAFEKLANGRWTFRGSTYAYTSNEVAPMAAHGLVLDGSRTLVLPKPAAPTLLTVGTLLADVTDAQLNALPSGSRFEDPEDVKRGCLDLYALNKGDDAWTVGWMPLVDSPMAEWRKAFGDKYRLVRIGPATSAPTPKPLDFGTRLSATTDADLDALPVGSRFEDWEPVLGLAHAPIVKTTAGWRLDVPNATPMSSAWWRGEFGGHRLARRGWVHTPNPGRDGDRLGSFAPSDLDALPVWAAFTSGASVIRKQSTGRWLNGPRVGIGDARWLLCNSDPNRTLTLPRSTK